jgi:hypothetical protein
MFHTILLIFTQFVNIVVLVIMTKVRKKNEPPVKTKRTEKKDSESCVTETVASNSRLQNGITSYESGSKLTSKELNVNQVSRNLNEVVGKHRAKRKCFQRPDSEKSVSRIRVILVPESACALIVDRLIPKSKIKVLRLSHSLRWLRSGPSQNKEDYGLDRREQDLDGDSEESPRKEIPAWARDGSSELMRGLRLTKRLDPDFIFGQCDPPDLDMLFVPGRSRRNVWNSYSSREGLWEED